MLSIVHATSKQLPLESPQKRVMVASWGDSIFLSFAGLEGDLVSKAIVPSVAGLSVVLAKVTFTSFWNLSGDTSTSHSTVETKVGETCESCSPSVSTVVGLVEFIS